MLDDYELYNLESTDSQVQSNSEERKLPPFKEIERYIFAVPLLDSMDEDELPHYSCNGYVWQFILQDQEDSMLSQFITYDMMEEWRISSRKLMRTASGNAQEFQDEAAYALLFCKTKTATIPFLKLYYARKVDCAPYGSSLILLPDVINKLHDLIGDFCTYIDNFDQVYVIQTAILDNANLNPWETFHEISKKDKGGEPFFFRVEFFFPRGKKQPSQDYNNDLGKF